MDCSRIFHAFGRDFLARNYKIIFINKNFGIEVSLLLLVDIEHGSNQVKSLAIYSYRTFVVCFRYLPPFTWTPPPPPTTPPASNHGPLSTIFTWTHSSDVYLPKNCACRFSKPPVLLGQLSSSPAHLSNSRRSAFLFCLFITFSLVSFLLPQFIIRSHWSAFLFPCSVITFSLVSFLFPCSSFITFSLASFLLPLLIRNILTGQFSSIPQLIIRSHWSAFFFSRAHLSHSHWSLVSFPLLLLIIRSHWSAFFYCNLSTVPICQPFFLCSPFHYCGRISNFLRRAFFFFCSFCVIIIGWLLFLLLKLLILLVYFCICCNSQCSLSTASILQQIFLVPVWRDIAVSISF